MRKYVMGLSIVLGTLLLAGCASAPPAPVSSTGGKIHIDVYCDRGDPKSMEEKQWGYRNEVGTFMEPNLVRRLGDYGFSSAQIQNVSDFKANTDSYLLKVKITSYNPGSAAARMMVGYGAGSCSLDCHYELVDSTGKVLSSWDDGVGTSGDWRRIPITLNKKAGIKLREYFAQNK